MRAWAIIAFLTIGLPLVMASADWFARKDRQPPLEIIPATQTS
ncbi:MAG: hypothetical protein WBD40_08805 [Tepidisphaeraceae bacterium]